MYPEPHISQWQREGFFCSVNYPRDLWAVRTGPRGRTVVFGLDVGI